MRRVFVLLAAFFFVAGIAGSALADKALFRAQRSFLNLPNPAVTTPGNAGKAIDPLVPGTIYKATYNAPQYYQGPAVADVQPGNPVGSPFTLPTGFESYQGTYTITSQTGWYGYTTISILSNWNGPGRFGPQHTHSGSTTVTTVFPTTGGNVDPNGGGVFQGQPALHCTVGTPNKPASSNLCGTTNYGGRYDFSRWGTIKVTPGPNQFGGTLKTLYGANSSWYQNIKYFSPTLYKAYGGFFCKVANNFAGPGEAFTDCTGSNSTSLRNNITQYGNLPRYLLTASGAKATRTLQSPPIFPTPQGLVSYQKKGNYYMHLVHPWTTGYAWINNRGVFTVRNTPRASGYDTDLGGVSLTVTETNWNQYYNYTAQTAQTNITTMKSYLQNVGRVVSMVQPRLTTGYNGPLDPADPVDVSWSVARMRMIKVFFLPEPTGMLLLGAGIATLFGLYRMRKH